MVKAIQDNKAYLGEVDGLIGDGDHGMNMNKGFSLFEKRFADADFTFTEGLDELGNILFAEIGGSMGPIYGKMCIRDSPSPRHLQRGDPQVGRRWGEGDRPERGLPV